MIDFLKKLFLILKDKPVLENNDKQNNTDDVELKSVSVLKKILYVLIFLIAIIFLVAIIYCVIKYFPIFIESVKNSYKDSEYILDNIHMK